MPEDERCEVTAALKGVAEVVLSVDQDRTVVQTLSSLGKKYAGRHIIFANGGDRSSVADIPETAICKQYGMDMRFGVGGSDKPQSSTNINKARGLE